MSEELKPDPEIFRKLMTATMPFGKYAGRRLVDLPEPYVVWFKQKGFPAGELGMLLETVYAVKANGLEYLFRPGASRP
ncbi:DUF3820 family protein [Tichowtungia aerotolerans]|uniref:DUF3820 family protein n=1 Tax=Tichowtungia aerotolerans TaxID=2697043 RepID=A0A6P1M5R2_9BACT|nr:DUF3820 family protein [Tichowtungia aerotolerans]QHI69197.1 hypothetical protein GT409_06940 [Tichowtungia aerotolerans]